MYKLSYEKCVCFIFLVILVFISCSGFHTDRLVPLTYQNKKYPFTSSSYSLNENAQYESDFVTRMINSNRALENRKLYVRGVHFAGMPGVGVSLTEGIDHRHPQRQSHHQQQHHNRRTRRHDLRRAYERRRKRREALLTAAYAPLQTRNNENSINPTPRRHQPHMDVTTTTTTATTTHIVNVQQHPRVVVTEHEPSSDLVRERRAAGQKPAGDNRKKDKKFCPGQDVGTRAYYAKTIIEGRLRSKSSTTNKKTYYVTVEVKRIYKNESNFRALNITEKIRLHFAIGRYRGCDRRLADGLVKAQLVNGKDYIFFLQSLGPHNYTVLGPPEPLDAKKVKAIKDIINNKKVKDARINVRLTNKTVKVNDILRLTCGVRGNPPPVVTWYKDGREIRGKRKRPRIKHMEKKSVLSIQNVDSSDAGKYECRAKGVIGKVVSSSALVTIQQDTTTTTTTTVPTDTEGSRVPCGSPQNEELCLNGGTCFFYTILGEMGCRCGEDYTGHRCENKAVSGKSSMYSSYCKLGLSNSYYC